MLTKIQTKSGTTRNFLLYVRTKTDETILDNFKWIWIRDIEFHYHVVVQSHIGHRLPTLGIFDLGNWVVPLSDI